MRSNKLLAFLFITLLAGWSLPAQAQQKQKINTTDILKIRQLGSVEISPDGKEVLYTVTSKVADEKGKNKYTYRTHLWMVSTDGLANPRQLTFGDQSASQPTWSPDGSRIAFVRNADTKPQIFVLSMEGGEAWQLTHFKYGASNPRWSPDGNRILFSASINQRDIEADDVLNGGQERPAWPLERAGRNDDMFSADTTNANPDGSLQQVRNWLQTNGLNNDPKVIYRLNFKDEKQLDPEPEFTHQFVIDVEGNATPLDLTPGYHSFYGARWMPDGERVVMAGNKDNDHHPDRVRDSELYMVGADGTGLSTLLDPEHYSLYNPVPSPDGSTVLFQGSDQRDRGYAQTMLGTIKADRSSRPRWLTESLDRSAYNQHWSDDGSQIYFTATSNGGFPLYRVSTSGGDAERLMDYNKGIRDFDVAHDEVVYVLTEISNPYELYSASADLSNPNQLSDHNASWIANRRLSIPEKHTLTRPDGTKVEYWIMKPTDFENGRKYPLITEIHGGPSAMWGPGEVTMWHEYQLLAAKGYGIVYSNPRGSGGYGREFQHANHKNWGAGPAGDVLAATDNAAAMPWTDEDRQVVTGGSYAGYLTAWIVGHDDRFKAAVAQRGVYDLETFMGEGNAWRLIPDRFGGYPWQDDVRKLLDHESPLMYADQIETPLLIMHGDVDYRTGPAQSEVLYRELKIMDKPVEYIRYPNAGHDLSRAGNITQRMDRLMRIYEFFERYIDHRD